MGYGTAQRFAFAGLVIGFLMCAAGTCAPFWQHAEINIDTLAKLFSVSIPFLGSTKLVTLDTGLWWYCTEYLGDKSCEFYKINKDDSSKIWACRIASVFSVLLSLICALVGLCRTCCGTGGKTVVHGVIAFFAGGAGVVTVAVFASGASEDDSLLDLDRSYEWAFYIYIAGTVIIVVVSFMLCFAMPDNPVGQVFPAPTAGGNTVIVANSTQQSQSYGGPQYAYPTTMYTGQPQPTYSDQQQQQYKYFQPPNQPYSPHDENTPKAWA